MRIAIGIDTGGTYTDAVAYDFETSAVLAKGKALTTKENLTVGIGNALDSLPVKLLKETNFVALSTTLATNACVEDKGGRAKLILMGTTRKVLEWIDAKQHYGLKPEDVLCLDTKGSFDGRIIDEPDWDAVFVESGDWLADAQALSCAEVNAIRNGAVCEKNAKTKLTEKYDVPVITGSELVSGLNIMERGATALLNARLLPVIAEFMESVKTAITERGLSAPVMIVRSDGSLMTDHHSRRRPVETILSGPAASVLGGRALTRAENCLIVDMGGTTTDISIIQNGSVEMAQRGIRIGNWRTQVKGVYMDTFGLGGDSAIRLKDNARLELCVRRVQPICVAASMYPEIKQPLEILMESCKKHVRPIYEFLYLVKEPKDISKYSAQEAAVCRGLKNGPVLLAEIEKAVGIDIYRLDTERLEKEGIVMRCGLTSTDIMHIRGDFSRFDREASVLMARYFMRCLPDYTDDEEGLFRFTEDIYGMVKQKLYENIVRILLSYRFPEQFANGLDAQMANFISQSWTLAKEGKNPLNDFFGFGFSTSAALIGIGAPTHIFLADVARALGSECIIPEHAAVANAVGAVVAHIETSTQIKVAPNYTSLGIENYTVYAPDGNLIFDELDDAVRAASEIAVKTATQEARLRGAIGELYIRIQDSPLVVNSKDGIPIDLGTHVFAFVSGSMQ